MDNAKEIINNYLINNKIDDIKPFLKHLDYFKDDNNLITKCSITDKWSKLSGEYRIKTLVKAHITIDTSNKMNPEYKKCPYNYKYEFESSEMMKILKHPFDTGIVNDDGSINKTNLEEFINKNFIEKDDEYILLESKMKECLNEFLERDKNVEVPVFYTLPSFQTVAKFEWLDFFSIFSNFDVINDRAVTINRFLDFYFNPTKLYNEKLDDKK